ncbi:MAG: hypothetical protein ACFFAO_07840 [Candidatus Hermodarchaeota archaeon]
MISSNSKDEALKSDNKDIYDEKNKNYIEIANHEYESLVSENRALKSIISSSFIKRLEVSSNKESDEVQYGKKTKADIGFYIKIILAISVIILSLAFHIVYLSVTSCLYHTNGSSQCWIKSWLGTRVNASFFIDLTLYLLIGLQLILIVLIIKNKISILNSKK